MEFGGIVLIAAALGLFALIPLLAARRVAMNQSREADRYSHQLRLLETDTTSRSRCEQSHTIPILAARRILPELEGELMAHSSQALPSAGVDRRAVQSVREIARLRSRRAARLAAEAAAGRRRLLISACLAIATALVGIIAAATALSGWWTLLPGTLLASSLGTSRYAAIRSQKADAAEVELLEELRGHISTAKRTHAAAEDEATLNAETQAAEDIDEIALVESLAESASESSTGSHVEDEGVDKLVDAQEDDGAQGRAQAQLGTEMRASHGGVSTAAVPDDQREELDGTPSELDTHLTRGATVERKTWTVNAIPAPSYAMRGRIAGRTVHADTDLRGIPKVEAKVPARPLHATSTSGARSTLDMVADQAVALDLDAVLEARRAQ